MARRKANPFVATFTTAGLASRQRVEGLYRALLPEAGAGLPGAAVKLRPVDGGRALEIRIEADNLRSLRAAVNSTLRWTALALDIAERVAPLAEDE